MQKKLIALAVAGLLSAPAFAQSNVTLYGTIDYGYTFLGKGLTAPAVQSGVNAGKLHSRNAIDSGIAKANRLGFKGVEDLGNGLKAVFVLESGFNSDTGDGYGTFTRQAYGGIAGNFGTVVFGRHYTPQHLFTSAVDPFAKNGLGSAGNVLLQDKRLDNLFAYVSPNWSGFSFIFGYTWSGIGNENNGNTGGLSTGGGGNARVWAFAPSFKWNNLFVAANYHQAQVQGHGSGILDDNGLFYVIDLYASYDFGPVKLGATVGQRTYDQDLVPTRGSDYKIRQAMIGATWKITSNDSLLFSAAHARDNWARQPSVNLGRAKVSQLAVGYEHNLSKRTALYAQYAHQFQNKYYKNNGFSTQVGADITGSRGGVGASNLKNGGNYRQGFAVGVRHDF